MEITAKSCDVADKVLAALRSMFQTQTLYTPNMTHAEIMYNEGIRRCIKEMEILINAHRNSAVARSEKYSQHS